MNTALTPDSYIASLPEDRQEALNQLRKLFKKNLPKGFEETISYGMIGYVVPHKLYPNGYHCDPKLPLTVFKHGLTKKCYFNLPYGVVCMDAQLLSSGLQLNTQSTVKTKLDMGKSCIRFKKPDQIPFELLGELASKMSLQQWIELYEKNLKR
jgi:uncharacterized protein YdhG (YjbR/CyaY superfamily)